MDSLLQHQSNCNPLLFGRLFSDTRRRGSTSQTCLHKILCIITTVPPPLAAEAPLCSVTETKESSAEDDKGSGFDLNAGLCISPEPKASFDTGMSSTSSTALEGGGPAGGCFDVIREDGGDRVEDEEHGNGGSDNSCIKIREAEGSLTLLIEAAKLIFGEFMDDDKSESGEQNVSRCSELKKDEMAEDINPIEGKLRTAAGTVEEIEEPPSSPVVRSKRGRTQVLPGKYRDSVLEPLTRFPRTRSPVLPSKRRRRSNKKYK